MLGESDVLVCITITTHLFSSILGSEEGPHSTLALGPLCVMIWPVVIEILPVFIVLGEDNILVCILITTHPFDLILGSEECPCPTVALDPLFMTMQLLVIKISSVFVILKKIPTGEPLVNLYPFKTQKGRGMSQVRVWVDIWTPTGTPLVFTVTVQLEKVEVHALCTIGDKN